VLIDIAESSVVDISIDENDVPIKREVRCGCEMLGLDPLNLVNEGKMVIVVAPEQADEIINQLHRHALGRESAIIGTVRRASSSIGRLVLRKEFVEQVVIRHEGQALPRLC